MDPQHWCSGFAFLICIRIRQTKCYYSFVSFTLSLKIPFLAFLAGSETNAIGAAAAASAIPVVRLRFTSLVPQRPPALAVIVGRYIPICWNILIIGNNLILLRGLTLWVWIFIYKDPVPIKQDPDLYAGFIPVLWNRNRNRRNRNFLTSGTGTSYECGFVMRIRIQVSEIKIKLISN
jgi:hypothetical protein